jgi:hypothetical protein
MEVRSVNPVISACEAAADSLVSQPSLFPAAAPSSPDIMAVSTRPREFSGAITTKNERLVLLVGALRELRVSDREIARKCGIARESIPALVRAAEQSGQLRPVKERLVGLLGDLAEQSGHALLELVEESRNPMGEGRSEVVSSLIRGLGPVLGIATEKLQLLTGQATEIVVTKRDPGLDDELTAWLRARPIDVTPDTGAPDAQSGVDATISAQIRPDVSPDTLPDTSTPVPPAPAGPQGGSIPAGAAGSTGAGGGIGSAPDVSDI